MFKKPATHKTAALVRSSDLRQLRAEVQEQFAGTSLARDVRTVLPDGSVLLHKATTHVNEPVQIFSSAAISAPLFFRPGRGKDGPLVPSVITLEAHLDALPAVVTNSTVVEHLIAGAALFAAGVDASTLPETTAVGSLVAVCLRDGSVQAVGTLEQSRGELMRNDRQGKAVNTLHARGDYLYQLGNGKGILDQQSEASPSDGPVQQVARLSVQEEAPPPPEDPDGILKTALLLAIKTRLGPMPAKSFPINASTLMQTHVRACLPTEHAQLDVKKTSFKKVAGLVKHAQKQGWLLSKDIKGESSVMSVNAHHPDVEAVRSYETAAKAKARSDKAANEAVAAAAKEGSSLDVVELYKPHNPAILQLLDDFPQKPEKGLWSHGDLKAGIAAYASAHNLAHPRDQRYLRVQGPDSETFAAAVLKSGEQSEAGVVSREDALTRLKDASQSWYAITVNGKREQRRGKPPTVSVVLKAVGKRTVTRVGGHELWGVMSHEDLAEALKTTAQSSASIQEVTGSSGQKKGKQQQFEVLVQGTHDTLVTRLLTEKGIPSRYIEVENRLKKK